MTRFEEYCARQQALHGDKFVPPTDPRFIDAYNKGQAYRIKVRTVYPGSDSTWERWGFVSLTTGWQPAFMLMRRSGQHGSSDLLGARDTIVDTNWIRPARRRIAA